MPKTKTKPGPKPKYGEFVEVHLRIDKQDYDLIKAMSTQPNGWMSDVIHHEVAQIRDKRMTPPTNGAREEHDDGSN